AIPEDRILWLDCGASLSDEVEAKMSATIQANISTVDKWLVSAGGAGCIVPTMKLFKENNIDIIN
ncbi:MAG: hypothetical protein IJE85_00260, partial [Bacteroidales bacterium]|nr:hypothetical protein [Bacteroidales bacterium]